jgi:riboflavin biosynthesis pyrimidine reductase
LNVVVSRSGDVDLQRAVFRTPSVRTLVVTSSPGRELLAKNGVAARASVEVRVIEGEGGKISPPSILKLLHDEFGVKRLLHEGGPTLFGDFLAHGCLDELFLTVAPRLAGRDAGRPRPGMVAGVAFPPQTAPWLELMTVKQCASHLYLRYDSRRNRTP